jgi:hypothetical protein
MVSTVWSKILVHSANQDAVLQVVSDGGADAEKLLSGRASWILGTIGESETRINCGISNV